MDYTNNNQIIIELPLDYEDFEKFVRNGTTPEQRTAIWAELYAMGRVPLDAVAAETPKQARQAKQMVEFARSAILAIVLDNLRLATIQSETKSTTNLKTATNDCSGTNKGVAENAR